MRIKKPSIVLVRPQLPENIGMVARAMDNCGLENLILVSPRNKWPNQIAINAAANSKLIFKKIKVFDSLNDALSKFNYVVATSNRKRFLNKPNGNNFNYLFKQMYSSEKTCIVFGPENSGLSNKDLLLCDYIFNIELSNSNNSLNLSHAVLILAYKWREFYLSSKKINKPIIKNKLATKKEFNFFMNYLKIQLEEVGFLYPKQKSQSMFNNIQAMLLRTNLSKVEINTLWGMIKKLKNVPK